MLCPVWPQRQMAQTGREERRGKTDEWSTHLLVTTHTDNTDTLFMCLCSCGMFQFTNTLCKQRATTAAPQGAWCRKWIDWHKTKLNEFNVHFPPSIPWLRCPWARHWTPNYSPVAAALTAHCSGCVFTAVCVHFGWVKYRARIQSMGHYTWSYVTSLSRSHIKCFILYIWVKYETSYFCGHINLNSPKRFHIHLKSIFILLTTLKYKINKLI